MSKSIEIDNLINNQLYGFRIFPRNLKGQYQTEIDGATATATPKAFSLPTYTGQHTIFGNETEGRIEMYTSGTLTLSPATYDIFAVGGGGGTWYNGAQLSGAGGGYTKTVKNYIIENLSNLQVYIGSGQSNNGGNTTIDPLISAYGGKGGSNSGTLPDGGSGGGSSNYNRNAGYSGGSDGSDGGGEIGGKGQHTTTRAFGETNGTLYAGGGGGGSNFDNQSGAGGLGGGGYGGDTARAGKNGTPNTGGGAGSVSPYVEGGEQTHVGGSGIAIIRWKNN